MFNFSSWLNASASRQDLWALAQIGTRSFTQLHLYQIPYTVVSVPDPVHSCIGTRSCTQLYRYQILFAVVHVPDPVCICIGTRSCTHFFYQTLHTIILVSDAVHNCFGTRSFTSLFRYQIQYTSGFVLDPSNMFYHYKILNHNLFVCTMECTRILSPHCEAGPVGAPCFTPCISMRTKMRLYLLCTRAISCQDAVHPVGIIVYTRTFTCTVLYNNTCTCTIV